MKTFFGAMAAALLLALPAQAQSYDDLESIRLNDSDMGGLTVSLEGGLSSFTGGVADVTEPGPLWGVRAGVDREVLGLELAYEGSRNGFEDPRLAEESALYRHELEGLAKAGLDVGMNLKPFVGAGLGVTYVNVTDSAETLYRNDFHAQVPVAAGVDWNAGALHAGVRATWSFLFGDEFAEPTASADNPDSGLFTTSLVVGGSF